MNWVALASIATVGAVAGGLYWAMRGTNKVPTFRMFLTLTLGGSLAYVFNDWLRTAFEWFTGLLPWQAAALVTAIPAGVAAWAVWLFAVHLSPKEKPARREEWAALLLPIMGIFVAGGILGTVANLPTKQVNKAGHTIQAELTGTGKPGGK